MPARIQNITTAAAQFDGVLVAPGEIFSMGEALGDVSLDNGFTEALIIYGGRTIKGVGGGVCQVSTTLFRTAFLAGFPIVERVPHAYRVSYYEQTSGGIDPNLAGMDATVYFPLVDFKFKNDSAYWILMETSVDESSRSLTWRFYSTWDGRTVQWENGGLQNVVPAPKPLFRIECRSQARADHAGGLRRERRRHQCGTHGTEGRRASTSRTMSRRTTRRGRQCASMHAA